jgi:hypothetical protein
MDFRLDYAATIISIYFGTILSGPTLLVVITALIELSNVHGE